VDIDRDRRTTDVVGLAAPFAPGSCGVFLVAKTRSAKFAARVPPYYGGISATAGVSSTTEPPRLAGRFRLGSTPIVAVETNRGAHASFFALYRFWRGKLTRLSVQGRRIAEVGENYGSTNFGGTYCLRSGLLVEWFGSIHYPGPGDEVDFARRTFRLDWQALKPARTESRRVRLRKVWSTIRKGPAYTPFDGCRFSPR
jgi:hypothetical protein